MTRLPATPAIPTIDLTRPAAAIGEQIDRACCDLGFFLAVGHGVDLGLLGQLERAARTFFALPDARKEEIAMAHGGRAWRGWFPLGGELTSGIPDQKEGLYFGKELARSDPRVAAGTPLHGPNLFPAEPPELRRAVLDTISALTRVASDVLAAMAAGLGLAPEWFATNLTADPTILFRIFRYPPAAGEWGVREHTDYGLVTVLAHDGRPGLQVHGRDGWIDVAAPREAFVVNLGDMLETLTARRWRSTLHRVRNLGNRDRLTFPLFCDPSWDATVVPLPIAAPTRERGGPPRARWDAADPLAWSGTYGEYLTAKVKKVFPGLGGPATHRPS